MQKEEVLSTYGLSDKETKVYLALLPLGSVNLQEIARKIELPRTTIYNTLSYLSQKGLVSYIVKEGIHYYEASEPEKIIDNLDEKRKLIDSVLPELKAIKKDVLKTSDVRIYQGFKGVFAVLSEVFRTKEDVDYFGSYTLSKQILAHLPEHFRAIRMEKRISSRIVIDKYHEDIFMDREYKKITKIRFNNSLKDFPCMIFIYGKSVALYTVKKELIAITIQNEQVADAMKMVFELYWASSTKD